MCPTRLSCQKSEDDILAAFKSLKPDTAPGIYGWTHHLLAVALRSPLVLKAIHTLTGLIQRGEAPRTTIPVRLSAYTTQKA